MFYYPYLNHTPYGKYASFSPHHPASLTHWQSQNPIQNFSSPHEEIKKETPKESQSTSQIKSYINLLGIRLQFDDILLILIIYFLYTEGVKDIYLFIILILLLLT